MDFFFKIQTILPVNEAHRFIMTCDSLPLSLMSGNDKSLVGLSDAKPKNVDTNDHILLVEFFCDPLSVIFLG